MSSGVDVRRSVLARLTLRNIVQVVAVGYVVMYIGIALHRLRYPFELEWMEGGSVEHVRRLLDGQQLYRAPTVDFTTYIYPPLFFYVSAAVAKVVGVGFFALRLVSFISSLACFLFIWLLVKVETKNRLAATLAVGLFAAAFRAAGAWMDIARVDSLSLALLLASLWVVRRAESWRAVVLGAVLVLLAAFTKQSIVLAIPALAVYLVRLRWRWAVLFGAITATGVVASTVLMDIWTDGWYRYYVYDMPSSHPILRDVFLTFWTVDVLGHLGIALALALLFLVLAPSLERDGALVPLSRWFYLPVVGAMAAGAWISRLHLGGYDNVLLPVFAGGAVLFGVAVHAAFHFIDSLPPARQHPAQLVVYGVCLLQLLTLAYNPSQQLPAAHNEVLGRQFIDRVRSVDGEVLVADHAFYAELAGKSGGAQTLAMADVFRGPSGRATDSLHQSIDDAVHTHRFAVIVLSGVPADSGMPADFLDYYEALGPAMDPPGALIPATGFFHGRETWYVPK